MPPTDELVREIDLESIGKALSESFPDLSPITPLRHVDNGFSSFVVETPAGVIFRVARHAAVGQAYIRERASLPLLREHLPLPIPDLRWYAQPSPAVPHGAIGYPKLPGLPVTSTAQSNDPIAAGVAQFLATLHAVQPETLPLAKQSPDERLAQWAALHAECLAALDDVLESEEYYQVARWWDEFLSDPLLLEFTPTVRHGDLWFGNLLLDESESRVAGVLDFERLAIADPAEDFAAQLEWSEEFAASVLEKYQAIGGTADQTTAERARRLWQLRPFEGLLWSVRFDDRVELAEAVGKLRRAGVLSQRE